MKSICIALTFTAVISSAFGQGSSPSLVQVVRSAIPMGDKVAILRPAELAVPGRVVKYAWSGDGKNLMAFRQDTVKSNTDWLKSMKTMDDRMISNELTQPDGLTVEGWSYRKDTRVAAKIFRASSSTWRPTSVDAVPKSDAFIVSGMENGDGSPGDFGSYFISSTGKVQVLSGPNDGIAETSPSPVTGLVAYWVGEYRSGGFVNCRAGLIGPQGVVKQMPMPEGFVGLYWLSDGVTVGAQIVRRVAGGIRNENNTVDWDRQSLTPIKDLTKEAARALANTPDPVPLTMPAQPSMEIEQWTDSVTFGKKTSAIVGTVLASEKESGFIAADVSQITVSPNFDAVAFVAHGSLFVRQIVMVDKAEFTRWKEKLEREEAIMAAKQVGLALIMLSADYDDKLPSNSADWQKMASPYLKNKDAIGRFVYQFRGGSATDVKEPSKEVMGYVPGPGGRAVTYMDGHVKWVKN